MKTDFYENPIFVLCAQVEEEIENILFFAIACSTARPLICRIEECLRIEVNTRKSEKNIIKEGKKAKNECKKYRQNAFICYAEYLNSLGLCTLVKNASTKACVSFLIFFTIPFSVIHSLFGFCWCNRYIAILAEWKLLVVGSCGNIVHSRHQTFCNDLHVAVNLSTDLERKTSCVEWNNVHTSNWTHFFQSKYIKEKRWRKRDKQSNNADGTTTTTKFQHQQSKRTKQSKKQKMCPVKFILHSSVTCDLCAKCAVWKVCKTWFASHMVTSTQRCRIEWVKKLFFSLSSFRSTIEFWLEDEGDDKEKEKKNCHIVSTTSNCNAISFGCFAWNCIVCLFRSRTNDEATD